MKTAPPSDGPAMPGDDAALAASIRRFEERVARDPESLAFAQLADLLRKAGRASEAVAVCRKGLVRYPHYTTARLILAKSLMADGAVDAALAEMADVLQASPKDVGAHRLAADLERQRGRVDVAAEHLEAVARLDPHDRDARALCALLRADPAASDASALARVLRDDTFMTPAFAALCLEQGAIEEAAAVFTRILRKDPDHQAAREGLDAALRTRSRRKG